MDSQGFNNLISSKAKAPKEEDLKEEDIWAVNLMKEREGLSSLKGKRAQDYSLSAAAAAAAACRMVPAVPKFIPRVNNRSSSENQFMTHDQSSAPVSIPDWSKIYTKNIYSNDAWANGNGTVAVIADDDDDYDENSDEMVPPHEFIARRLARSPVVSYSMCEGIGRTLKGRDLSKLRNAILTKTGFLE